MTTEQDILTAPPEAPAPATALSRGLHKQVEAKLRKAWRKERRFVHLRGLCTVIIWAVAMLLVDLLIDYLLSPGSARLILPIANLCILGVIVYRRWLRHLTRYDRVRVALQVERRHPELRSLLVSYVQFKDPGSLGLVSPSLLEAMRRQAVIETQPINFREIINYRDLKRILAVSLVTVLVFGGFGAARWQILDTLFYRLLHPGAEKAYPTRTHIDRISGDFSVKYGESAVVEAQCGGVVPDRGVLHMHPVNGEWGQVDLAADGHDAFAYKFPGVYVDFDYYVKIGDARSITHRVTVIPPPHIVKSGVHLTYPTYTSMPAIDQDDLNIQAPEGTKVEWNLTFDRPLKSAELIREPLAIFDATTGPDAGDDPGKPPTPVTLPASGPATRPAAMKLDPAGLHSTHALTADESFPYRFTWVEREHGYTYPEDVRYTLQCLPDNPPEIDILKPSEDIKATLEKLLTLRFSARDDFGLTKLTFAYTINDGPEALKLVGTLGGARQVEKDVSLKLKEIIPGLKENDILGFSLIVEDNKPGTANMARSRVGHIAIVSVAEYLKAMADEQARLVKEVQDLKREEEEANTAVEALSTQPSQTQPAAPP